MRAVSLCTMMSIDPNVSTRWRASNVGGRGPCLTPFHKPRRAASMLWPETGFSRDAVPTFGNREDMERPNEAGTVLGCMDRYAARICWNSKGWVTPSGDAPRLEHETYVTRVGFGHEEWLFNFQWVLDGWKYAFLQPVNKSLSRVQGGRLDVRLYTIGERKAWFYVGHIQPCEVLRDEQAEEARAAFRKRGWLGQMLEQVRQVGGKERGLKYPDPLLLFNVRFRPKDAEILDPMKPVGSKDAIRRARRYGLVMLEGPLARAVEEWPRRRGTTKRGAVGKVAEATSSVRNCANCRPGPPVGAIRPSGSRKWRRSVEYVTPTPRL